MVTVSFKGSGVDAIDPSLSGFGQGLQIGLTRINFEKGSVQLTDSSGNTKTLGTFSGLYSQDSKNSNVGSLIFKAKTKCTIAIGKAKYDYENLNEWVTFNYISEQSIEISRTATGQNPDVFDWQFFASDDPKFAFTIQQTNKDSEMEVIFPTLSRLNTDNSQGLGAGVFAQTTNLRGAKKVKVMLKTGAGAGSVAISAEVFDPASQSWMPTVLATDLFGTVATGQALELDIGDTIQQQGLFGDNSYIVRTDTIATTVSKSKDTAPLPIPTAGIASAVAQIGTLLSSGDNIFRFKATVTVGALVFSLGIHKVFD